MADKPFSLDPSFAATDLKAVWINPAGQYANEALDAMEAYNAANWTTTKYLQAVTANGKSGEFKTTVPAWLPGTAAAPIAYKLTIYFLPAAPTPSTTNDWPAGELDYVWNGTSEVTVGNVMTQVATMGSTGTGARTVTVTVNDGATALQSARVRLTEGSNSFVGTTNVSGQVVFNLNDATYTVAIAKDSYTFAGTTLVVDGTETPTYSMTAVTIPAPAAATQTTAYTTTRDGKGAATGSVTLFFRLLNPDGTVDAYDRANVSATSDVNGLLQIALKKSSTYEGRVGQRGPWTAFTTGSASTYELPEILGAHGS